MMRESRKKGFTLTELVVVLAIIAILLAVAIPSTLNYFKLAEFRKNESNAKTVYLAAESALTWYRTSGEWEEFRKDVVHLGMPNQDFGEGDDRYGRIYAITLNKSDEVPSDSQELVEELLENLSYDRDFLNASIVIEIDVDTGQVYSAFYGTRCSALKYSLTEEDQDRTGIVEIGEDQRDYEIRRKVLLGYYSVEDVTNVVDIKPVPLKITSINLVNSETLSLNWSGNSRHDNLDVAYTITFYQEPGGALQEERKLFSLEVDLYELTSRGWASGKTAALELSYLDASAAGNIVEGDWRFPLVYQEGKFSLVLDGMMSARLDALLQARKGTDDTEQKSFNTSITRLGEQIPSLRTLCEPQDIYAVVEAQCTYRGMGDDIREYSPSSPVKSNTENTLFAKVEEKAADDGTAMQEARITRFRHLSNIRHYAEDKAAEFVLAGSLDWTASGGGVYDVVSSAEAGETGYVLSWKEIARGEEPVLDFPSIPLFAEKHVLRKEGAGTKISNLHLGAGSVADDEWMEKLYPDTAEGHYSVYLGLFCESEGTIRDIVFQNPKVVLKGTGTDREGNPNPVQNYAHLYGVGLLAGRNAGSVEGVSVKSVRKSGSTGEIPRTLEVYLADRPGEAHKKPAGIGGLIGVLADKNADGSLKQLTAQSGVSIISIKDVTTEGMVAGSLPTPDEVSLPEGSTYALAREADTDGGEEQNPVEAAALEYRYGIGGIIGYAWTGEGVEIAGCENKADVTGNLFTGGVCGNFTGNFVKTATSQRTVSMEDCSNEGLVLCAVRTAETDGSNKEHMELSLEGRYFGGILGYGRNTWIKDSVSASGRGTDDPYTPEDRDKLQGWYVGGVLGYGSDSLLTGCGTKKGGYILGSDYVGGIAGGLSSNIAEAIKGDETGVAVTTNEGYVIGNRCVGGIVGKNDGTSQTVVKNCINNGAAVGYDRYIGGIVGYNGKNGKLEDCASYLSDYNNSIFNTIVKVWQAMGDCSGGLVGYNNGTIEFTGENEQIAVKSVASIAVGGNYVGGVIGFNDVDGELDVNYTLIGGRIYAFGDAAGGCIGLNASPGVLEQKLAIKPQSVQGRQFVGGVIGANVVDLPGDVTAGKLETNNVLGSVEGEAFVGGVMGYHRTYTQKQLKEAAQKAGMTIVEGENLSVLDYLWYGENPEADLDQYQSILPRLDGDNIPEKTLESANVHTLKFTKAQNEDGDAAWKEDSNNMSIRAYIYAGGIVGYCEQSSRLHLVNCKNIGGISRPAASAAADSPSRAAEGVSLVKYLEKEGGITLTEEEEAELEDLKVYMVGGMISANLQNQVIDHCVNKGSMNGFVGLGGIVGFNAGGVFSCALEDNFGSSELDYIGGIAGLNIGSGQKADDTKQQYTDYAGKDIEYTPGTIASCTTAGGKSVLGRSYVGGIAGYNMRGGMLEDNLSSASVSAAGNGEIAYVGGIAGCNNGWLAIVEDRSQEARTIRADQGAGVGGIAGMNRPGGCIYVKTPGTGIGSKEELVVVGEKVTVTGWLKVGGIVGINQGTLSAKDMGPDAPSSGNDATLPWLTCQAKEVRAVSGYAGGIAGEANGSISRAGNRSLRVTADRGPAGGIVAVNGENITLSQCRNYGSVYADKGYAGGIAAENYGVIADCSVGFAAAAGGGDQQSLTISSKGVDAIGAVCAVNHGKGDKKEDETAAAGNALLYASVPYTGVILSGNAEITGGIIGINRGILGKEGDADKTVVNHVPKIESTFSGRLTVGAAAGENRGVAGSSEEEGPREGTILNVTVEGVAFDDFKNTAYLGGIVGRNRAWAEVALCSFSGRIAQEAGNAAAGDCYGGIAGENSGELKDCQIRSSEFDIRGGVYTATSISTAAEKEALSSHVGGICGKNERYVDESGTAVCGKIIGCVIEGNTSPKTEIMVANGMAGGIAGYNKGVIELSGDKDMVVTALLKSGMGSDGRISSAERIETAAAMLDKAGRKAQDAGYVTWGGENAELESLSYSGQGGGVNANRSMSMTLSNNGNAGGITAYNAPSGSVDYCATGNWYLNNKSNAIGVGTGGIIGMNESEEDLSFLVNKAFVGRQISNVDTNRFAGGIIGNQNNTTKSEWKIENCANYGTVYCLNTHYSGGILGQWTGTGGTLERCYNYGNLQTTWEKGWLGAAGGIVAQLYHAYEGNHYNIVSCENYGNLYGKHGADREDGVIKGCANDSAGILGNITAYEAKNEAAAQRFTVQVLDCVNGSGVEIYSASMASGIVGFVSCDNADNAKQIITATKNIEIRIERCRNFAAVLEGGGGESNKFSAGIFGDRYVGQETRTQNTVIKDCYSVNPQAGINYPGYHYRTAGYPIISYRNGQSNAGAIAAGRNYFLENGSNAANSFVNNGKINDSSGGGNGVILTAEDLTGKPLGRAGTNRAYKVQGTSGKYYVIVLNNGGIFEKCKIDANGRVLDGKNNVIGNVLFDTGNTDFSSLYNGQSGNSVMVRDSDFNSYVRESYHRIEGAENNKMPRPTVSLEQVSGSSQMTVRVAPGEGSDPFKYIATLYKGDKVIKENYTFYSETDTFEISPEDAGADGEWKIVLRAYSMYDSVEPSEPADSTSNPIQESVLPNPDIRIELAADNNGKLSYLYQLQNLADYAGYESGTDMKMYDIVVKFMDATGQAGSEAEIRLGDNGEFSREQQASSLQQLIVQAVPKEGYENNLLPSAEVSVPVYLPGNDIQYCPSIPLKSGGNDKVSYELSGTSLSDARLTVTLDATGSGNVTTPPIYRVELIGTWTTGDTEVKEAVLAYQNILAAANGTASAVFDNLDQYDYIANAEDLQVRVWYAESGLGPVYTWHLVSVNEAGQPEENANLSVLTGVKEEPNGGGTTLIPEWNYEYSVVLAGQDSVFRNYVWTSQEDIFTWLAAPVLTPGEGEENFLKPEYPDPDKKLHYTFKWDQDAGPKKDGYMVSLAGIDRETGERVSLVTDAVILDNTYSVPAEEWNYSQVELTVTSLGDASKGTIGLSSKGIYSVASRLPKPGQPVVTNTDVNEMTYRIEWNPVNPEEGCVSYQIYMQLYDENGTLKEPVEIGEPVAVADKQGNRYISSDINLEEYLDNVSESRRALIYVVAQADETKPQLGYVNSLPGITYELQIPARIQTPKVEWEYSWKYNKDDPLSVEEFQQNGMTVKVEPDQNSIPPGGSTYLLTAWVVDGSEIEAVKTVIEAVNREGRLPDRDAVPGLQTVYPAADDGIAPTQMDVEANQIYSHSLNGLSAEYAGKYIFFCTRISSGNGSFSSGWVAGDLVRLPYVKLAEPAVTGDMRSRTVTMTTYTNPDLPEDSVEEIWRANHIAFHWGAVEHADSYYMTVTPRPGSGNQTPTELKIVEETGADGETLPKVYVKAADGSWTELTGVTGEDGSLMFDFGYSYPISGKYEAGGIPVFYKGTLSAALEAQRDENGNYVYTLILPDVNDLVTAKDVVITGDNLRNTASVDIWADVKENDPNQGSESYVESERVQNVIGN